MKINGIGVVKKEKIFSILSNEGKKAIKEGTLTMEEAALMYKNELVRNASKIGSYEGTFAANYKRIPYALKERLSPAELAELVDAFYDCYGDGKAEGKREVC